MYNEYSSFSDTDALFLILGGFLLVAVVITILNYLLTIYPMYKMSQKANLKSPKLAFVPIVRFKNLYNLANLSFWFYLVTFASFIPYIGPIISIVLMAYIHYKLAENFGLSTLGCIASIFFPLIAYWYIALSDKELVGTLNPQFLSDEPKATINYNYNY